MKRKAGNYLQLSREIFQDPKFHALSTTAKWLYVVLVELEHKFTGEKENFFFRSNEDLAKDVGVSLPTLKRAKKELKPFISTFFVHWVDKESGRKSKKYISGYRMKE